MRILGKNALFPLALTKSAQNKRYLQNDPESLAHGHLAFARASLNKEKKVFANAERANERIFGAFYSVLGGKRVL